MELRRANASVLGRVMISAVGIDGMQPAKANPTAEQAAFRKTTRMVSPPCWSPRRGLTLPRSKALGYLDGAASGLNEVDGFRAAGNRPHSAKDRSAAVGSSMTR